MIHLLPAKKPEAYTMIQLTLEDLEKNLRKSSNQNSDNLDEFLKKARNSQGSDGFITVSISQSAVPYEEISDFPELQDSSKTSEILFQNPSKNSKFYSRSRFEPMPLEAIEECLIEDSFIKNELSAKFKYRSQQLSPRNLNTLNEKSDSKKQKRKNKPRRKTWKKPAGLPAPQVLSKSAEKLPSIKLPNPVLRSFKGIDFLKKHKKMNGKK